MTTLRPYQQTAVDALRASFAAGRRAPLFVLPTGGGKTFVFSYIAQNAVERGRRVGILVHRRELLLQASASLSALGVNHGLIAPGFPRTQHPVQIASVQTLARRSAQQQFDLLIVDEAHHCTAGTWRAIIESQPTARLLGVTATPIRSDGQGLDEVFDDIIVGPSMQELIELGYLTKSVVYAPPVGIDLTGIRKRGGDFDRGQVAERVDKPSITGDVCAHYRKLAGGLPAIAFCASVAHAEHVAAEFRAHGFKARSVDGGMDHAERAAAIAALGNGDIHVLTSCDIISEGTDVPVVAAAILLRPTQSLGLYIQQVGRVLRPAPGKSRSVILDHVGNCLRHGLPDQEIEWTLQGTAGSGGSKSANDNVPTVRQCENCYFCYQPTQPACPSCGHVQQTKVREIKATDGELIELDAARAAELKRQQQREVSQARTLEDLQEVARRRGYSVHWARHVFNARQRRYG